MQNNTEEAAKQNELWDKLMSEWKEVSENLPEERILPYLKSKFILADASKEEPKVLDELKTTLKNSLRSYALDDDYGLENIWKLILPHLRGISNQIPNNSEAEFLDIIDSNINEAIKTLSNANTQSAKAYADGRKTAYMIIKEEFTEFLKSKGITPVDK